MSTLVLDAEALYRELHKGVQQMRAADTRLVGITSGGAWLAERLHKDLGLAGGVGIISSAMHRDDFAKRGMSGAGQQTQLDFDVNDSHIVLLDDVLYTRRPQRVVRLRTACQREARGAGRSRRARTAGACGLRRGAGELARVPVPCARARRRR
jgi:pyrimidine operon attenuation protein/uracil phosphoribosyltransferase